MSSAKQPVSSTIYIYIYIKQLVTMIDIQNKIPYKLYTKENIKNYTTIYDMFRLQVAFDISHYNQ